MDKPNPTAGPAFRALIPVLLLVACGFSGCGRKDELPHPAPAPSDGLESTTPRRPRTGGQLRLPLGGVNSLDPARSTSSGENQVIQQVFQGLVRLDSRLRVIPDLAQWRLSPDRTTYTFHLDPDARFHNDEPVTSADVVYSLRRLLDRRVGSPASRYFRQALGGELDGIRNPDPHTVVIQLAEPDNVFISYLAMQHTRIVPEGEADKRGFRDHPIGSGPFRFAGRKEDRIVLEAVRRGGSQPYLDRVEFLDIDRTEKELLLDGSVDYLFSAPGEIEELEESGEFHLTRFPTLTLHFLGLDVSTPPFDDLRIRKALAHGIDRQAFFDQTKGRVEPARTVLPPGMPGYDPAYDPYPFDPELAHRLLAEAGFSGEAGKELTVKIFSGRIPEQTIVNSLISSQLARLGIRAEIEVTDHYVTFLSHLRKKQAAVLGWGADYPDPENLFSNLFRTGAPHNFMKYSSERCDKLIDQARRGPDKVNRAMLYREAERVILGEDCIIVPLFHDAALHCVRKSVRGLSVNALGIYYTRLDSVWLDEVTEQRRAAP